ncbi:NUDIX domain-containing protein [Consotaella salsifontis]|uniref:ADP-ribose pyrophosphatase YjhB, NUDIX family n=1 Tax=Consotaella salsifontis TaxID=1365950 RepID=A0A1T4NVW7_9HYPH|nr:NUDIX domain-containing protein [Consotaella salsifontis]SJZ83335.1 ADP-ribose pyrophosphatase YjhB, NUDIX family [Consotaella salsifontis]
MASASKIYLRLMHVAHLLRRPMTLGVRGAAFDAEGRVFLVRHTYVSGWHMPGGGVDRAETAEAALVREMWEEGRITLSGERRLFGVYLNDHASPRDHVLFYRCEGAEQTEAFRPNYEIAEAGFFHPEALPEGTTPGTRRRLAELLHGAPLADRW